MVRKRVDFKDGNGKIYGEFRNGVGRGGGERQ